MALSPNIVWEVRASGASDNNGGGFRVGAAGTDRSQQNAAQVAIDNSTITTSITANVITFTGYTPTSADVGNVVQMLTGTNVTAGFYEITAQTGTTWTVTGAASLPTSGTTTNATGNMGGALATIAKLSAAMVTSNVGWITGNFTSTATHTFAQTASPPSNVLPFSRIRGYGSARGDTGHATLTLATNTGLIGFNFTGFGWQIDQVDVDCASLGTSTGIKAAAYADIRNCLVKNFGSGGISTTNADTLVDHCEVTGGLSGAFGIGVASPGDCSYNYVHDNACTAIQCGTGVKIIGNLCVNNSGATSDGISVSDSILIERNTCHNNGRNGIHYIASFHVNVLIRNNILTSNGASGTGYGFSSDATFPASPNWDGNAYFGNASGTRNNVDSVAGGYAQNPYTNTKDVILTGSPYVGPTTGSTANFGLNNTAGAGAACRAAATPNTWPGLSGTTSYQDMGAVQHQDSGGGGGMVKLVGDSGGLVG